MGHGTGGIAIRPPFANLLGAHAAAEDAVFYPRLLHMRSTDTEEETPDAIDDQNDHCCAVARAADIEVGSAKWWSSTPDARAANSEHMGVEERTALRSFRIHAVTRSSDRATRTRINMSAATSETGKGMSQVPHSVVDAAGI